METKNNPNPNGCLMRALPDEPMFILLARDASAPEAIRRWCDMRARDGIESENRQDAEQLEEAFATADAMEAWRLANDGRWKDPAASAWPDEVEAVAREIWRYNEIPWDFDKPDGMMAELQRNLAVDQAACIIAMLGTRRASALPPIHIDRSKQQEQADGSAYRMAGRVVPTPRGVVRVADAPGFTTLMITSPEGTQFSRVGIMLYDPPADTESGIGSAMVAQMDVDQAESMGNSALKLAREIRESRGE